MGNATDNPDLDYLKKSPAKSYHPLKLLFYIVLGIFVAEFAVNFILNYFYLPLGLESLIDASLLILIIYPALYYLSFKPLIKEVENLKNTKEKLKSQNIDLEVTKKNMANALKDLTSEKEKLQQEKVKDETMLGSIGEGLIVTDEKGYINLVNHSAEMLLGAKCEELTGKKLVDTIIALDESNVPIPKDKRALTKALLFGKPTFSSNHFYVRKDKTYFPITATVTPIVLNKKIIGTIEVFRDITREKEIDREKREFLSVAAHQLRTPLGTMRWNTELLLEDKTEILSDRAKESVKKLYENILFMINLINDLLDFSRIDQGKILIKSEATQILPLIQKAIKDLEPEAAKNNIAINLDVKNDTIPKVILDPNRFSEVMKNLLTNAIKYNIPDGKVSIEVEKSDKSVKIIIIDTGIGIPQNDQYQVFSKFFRAHNASLRETGGTGLGLFVVKSYVEAWGGQVRFTSIEGKGSTFTITIPL